MEYRGQKSDRGVEASDLDPKVALLQDLTEAVRKPPMVSLVINHGTELPEAPPGKIEAKEANYVSDAMPPFQCGNCQYIVWGQADGGEYDYCQLVKGPYKGGGIYPKDSCRFWEAKPRLA